MNEYLELAAKFAGGIAGQTSVEEIYDSQIPICEKCGKPTKFKLPNGEYVPATCDCESLKEAEEWRKEQETKKEKEKQERRKRCFSLPILQECRFANADPNTPNIKAFQKYVERWEEVKKSGTGIILWGGTGSGKTFIAACIANEVIDLGDNARFLNMGDVLLGVNGNFNKIDYLEEISDKPDLLVIDDFGTERTTDFGAEIKHRLIDRRCLSGKPLIITTNYSLKDLENPVDVSDKRVFDRLLSCCAPVRVNGENRRKKQAAARADWVAKEIFGL